MPATAELAAASQVRDRCPLPFGRMTIDSDGKVYANDSRFKAHLLVRLLKEGETPERLASPDWYGHAVTVDDVRAVEAWYQTNRDEVDAALREKDRREDYWLSEHLADPEVLKRRDRFRHARDMRLRDGKIPTRAELDAEYAAEGRDG